MRNEKPRKGKKMNLKPYQRDYAVVGEPIPKDTYQRRMYLMRQKGDKSIAKCPRCSKYYRRSAMSNICRHCRKEK